MAELFKQQTGINGAGGTSVITASTVRWPDGQECLVLEQPCYNRHGLDEPDIVALDEDAQRTLLIKLMQKFGARAGGE